MLTTLAAELPWLAKGQVLLSSLRAGERVAVLFFFYLSALAVFRHLPLLEWVWLAGIPVAICGLGLYESAHSTAWLRVLRDWLALGSILAAYWSVGWFAAPPLVAWQEKWVGWDRLLLNEWGLRAAIESAGALGPAVLETVYLFLYAIPPVCLLAIYRLGGRAQVHAFLFTVLLGALMAYALLPLFPVQGPRVAYAGLDLPNFTGAARVLNGWLLDRLDIPTSVFPSGHVAVAFSAAFGMRRAVPERRALWAAVFGVAIVVFVATIYCRYHYTADGLASIAVAATAWLASEWGSRDA